MSVKRTGERRHLPDVA